MTGIDLVDGAAVMEMSNPAYQGARTVWTRNGQLQTSQPLDGGFGSLEAASKKYAAECYPKVIL
jgi:hypothetical protein